MAKHLNVEEVVVIRLMKILDAMMKIDTNSDVLNMLMTLATSENNLDNR